ncbi:unnamed protein product, partial [Closterium sp. Yama58-4]
PLHQQAHLRSSSDVRLVGASQDRVTFAFLRFCCICLGVKARARAESPCCLRGVHQCRFLLGRFHEHLPLHSVVADLLERLQHLKQAGDVLRWIA